MSVLRSEKKTWSRTLSPEGGTPDDPPGRVQYIKKAHKWHVGLFYMRKKNKNKRGYVGWRVGAKLGDGGMGPNHMGLICAGTLRVIMCPQVDCPVAQNGYISAHREYCTKKAI